VISNFTAAEEKALAEMIDRCVAGIETFVDAGIDDAVALVNVAGGDPP
ncbi:MAG: hypothetical protein JO293_04375, partial [Candidatus Eremiobacteraeota bacterium]|nr:hypothetical protein [Candidatus Eremiobacteraeota bacterium]